MHNEFKMKVYKAPSLVLVMVIVLFFSYCRKESIEDSPIITDLINLIDNDNQFHENLKEALLNRPEENYWYGKSVSDLIDFFKEWEVALPMPDPEKVRYYDDIFGKFYTEDSVIESAKTLVRSEPFKGWIYRFVQARGAYMNSKPSATYVDEWMQIPEMRIDDYIIPENGFHSFNHFFTREIKPGARPIHNLLDKSVVTSPADCSISNFVIPLSEKSEIFVKNDSLSASDLLDGDLDFVKFFGGSAVILSLDITNYHRFHSPVSGEVVEARLVPGLYFGMTSFDEFFTENHRGYLLIKTADYGLVGLVAIGIATISSVNLRVNAGINVTKGEELGNFAFGGSAIVILFEPNRFTLDQFNGDNNILMGQKIGTLSN